MERRRDGPSRGGFLDLVRDQKRWNQAKIAVGKVGSAPIAVWMKLLQDLIFKELGVAS